MQPDDIFGPRCHGCDCIDVQIRSVGRQDHVGSAYRIQPGEDLLFNLHVLEHRLNNHIGIGKISIVRCALEATGHNGIVLALAQFVAFDRSHQQFRDGRTCALAGIFIALGEGYTQPRQQGADRYACTHRAATNDPDSGELPRPHALDLGKLADLTFAEERVDQGHALIRAHQILKQCAFLRKPFGKGQCHRPLNGVDTFLRRDLTTGRLCELGPCRIKHLCIGRMTRKRARRAYALSLGDHFPGKIDARRAHIITIGDPVDDPQLQRLFRIDLTACCDHRKCFIYRSQPWQALGPAGARHQTKGYFGKAKPRTR